MGVRLACNNLLLVTALQHTFVRQTVSAIDQANGHILAITRGPIGTNSKLSLSLVSLGARQVLPHERQAVRASKKSISAREALPSEVWSEVVNANVFDVLLFHWAKRMYLERSACRSFDQETVSKLPPKIAIEEPSEGT